MTNISIRVPQSILDNYHLSYQEFLYLLIKTTGVSSQNIKDSLIKKNIGKLSKYKKRFYISNKEHDLINSIYSDYRKYLINMKRNTLIDSDLIECAEEMQNLYPKGTRPGCSTKWRGNKLLIARKLTALQQEYGVEFTKEQAVDATRRYIESFNGNFTYMECLEYFILRERPEFKSNFISYLEDSEEQDTISDDILNLRN